MQVLKEVRESILVAERIVLHTLCFEFNLEHPIGLCVLKVKIDLKCEYMRNAPSSCYLFSMHLGVICVMGGISSGGVQPSSRTTGRSN